MKKAFACPADAHVSIEPAIEQRLFLTGIAKATGKKDGIDPAAALFDLLQHAANPLGHN